MTSQNERGDNEAPGDAVPAAPATSNPALASRFQQMFPVLSTAEIDRVRRFGEVRRFPAGELLFQAGEAVPGMYVILSGRVAILPRDALGQGVPMAAFAQLIGAPVEEMTEVVPGEVIAEIGQLSGRADLSVFDARAVGDVEAIVVPPEALRALLVAEAELGERILRALILRRAALIEIGFGGPVLVGALKSPDVTRLSHFLERNAIPFRVVDPDEDRDASSLLARFAPKPGELPIVVLSDGTVLKNPPKQELAQALGLVATSFRSEPYDVAIVGAGPAGLATAVYGASEGLSVLVLEAHAFGGQAGASARIENYLGFPTGVSGLALMGRAFTQAQKFGAEFSLSTEVKRLDCISESSGPDPVHILELADGRRVRARTVVVATGARYRRPEIPNLAQFEGRGVSYWASPVEARLCREEDVALLGGGNSAGQAAVFLASHARHVRVLVRGPGLSSTMSRYLIDRIRAAPNIALLCDTEVVELLGTPDKGLQAVRWRNQRTGAEEQHAIAHLFLFTGADPAASWLAGCGIPLDEKGFIRTGAEVGPTDRVPLPLETGVEGIFAVGDVRCDSVKRVGAAIGEGAAVVAQLHTFLARRGSAPTSATRATAP
ncbi:MAG TPA: FAD-dependent oxidoreductase [Vicinamibacteria bacterium]|jgi:thioredoxin reductase (NADPH)|nr:FAD-dependent oxidoreductase [Vicinamibacteria bacterium]